ncbi:MAG: hypothetical protein K2M91_03575 [Lachnospiraceae bacterium]|nr:hypothetical protein [Lachnospiraceae bacterium]
MALDARAKIKIKNETASTIDNVVVLHKYSNVYKDHLSIGSITNGEESNAEIVRYRINEIGFDWWMLIWKKENDSYYSAPNNLTRASDFVEKYCQRLMNITSGAAAVSTVVNPSMTSKIVSASLAVATAVTSSAMNGEEVRGFKEHMLTEEDKEESDKTTIIRIKENGKILFESPSGVSETVYVKGSVPQYTSLFTESVPPITDLNGLV